METPPPPCDGCSGLCCVSTQGGPFVELHLDELDRYPNAVWVDDGFRGTVPALPVTDQNRCVYLSEQNRCEIYDNRPKVCRGYNCVPGYRFCKHRHSFILEDHPELVQLIELRYPEFAEFRREEQRLLPDG